MANQPIPVAQANEMKDAYISYMEGLGVDMNQQTQSVSFNAEILLSYLSQTVQFADEFRVFMGSYPDGRTTVVVWPYRNGEPSTGSGGEGDLLEPFNDGHGNP